MTDESKTPVTDGSRAPLAGRSVLVTRTREQAQSLVRPLEALGAEVLTMPVLETIDPADWGPVDAAIANIGTYDWIVFTSTNGVERFLHRFRGLHGSHIDLESTCIAAVGSATAHRLRAEGFPPELVPEDFRAEGLVDAFRELGSEKCRRVLIPRAEEAREVFPEALREMGCDVDVVVVYRTAPASPDPEVLGRLREGRIDVLTFTSGAIATAFATVVSSAGIDVHEVMEDALVASIGPVTTEALHALGFEEDVEARESTMPALVEAIADAFEPPAEPLLP